MRVMSRLVALLAALLMTASTAGADWLLCDGSARSSAARHACCDDMQMRVSAQQASSCCALSEQSRDRAPVEARLVPQPAAAVAMPRLPAAPERALRSRWLDVAVAPPAQSVPIYLQQRSLLI